MASDVEELLKVVPRLVDRTRRQADFARALLAAVPCLSGLAPNADRTSSPDRTDSSEGADRPAQPGVGAELDGDAGAEEPVDVLSVLEAKGPVAAVATEVGSGPSAGTDAPPPTTAPDVTTLAIESYDSLAASQVVPRLVTLSKVELEAVQRYEQAHRHRQTILNRVAQLLEG